MKKRTTKLKYLGLTFAGLSAVLSSSTIAAHNMQVESKGGLKVFSPSEDDHWFGIGGRLNFDETQFAGGYQDKKQDFPSGGNIRRVFLKLVGGVGDYLSYNLTMRFNGTQARFEDAWLNAGSEYTGPINAANLRFGQFTPPTTIDDWGNYGTLNDTMFLESALATTAFSTPTKVYGIWADASALDMFMLSAAAYQPRQANVDNYGNPARSDRLGGSARLTFSPVHTDSTVYHVGVVGRYQSLNNHDMNGNPLTASNTREPNVFSTRPEARARNTSSLVDTGFIRARSYNVVAGEALAMWGPATLEGEYFQADVQRVPNINDGPLGKDNPRFHGWHVQGGYLLTGESRRYDFATGTLRNPLPANKLGAWEIVARFSFVNLVDKNVYGGSEHNTSFGVNWFINDNVRIGANYIRASIHNTGVPAGRAPVVQSTEPAKRQLDIVGLRFAVAF